MQHAAFQREASGEDLIRWYRRNRDRTASIFALVREEAYYDRPIALRNPIVFYEGHIPAFAINTLLKLTLGQRGIDEELEVLFARGIDPEDEASAKTPTDFWPSRKEVQDYVRRADACVENVLRSAADDPTAHEAIYTILEHEQMHQETFLYMLHNLAHEKKKSGPLPPARNFSAAPPAPSMVKIASGRATLGQSDGVFGWDNEFPRHSAHVDAFSIDTLNVTNGDYLQFMKATGASAPHFWIRRENQWIWRGMLEDIPLPMDWPVWVTHEEAVAYAAWKNKRLPSEAEWQLAAGSDTGDGNYDFKSVDPVPVGSFAPNDRGIYDLYGNGWEWTSTVFDGFEGFKPMRSYPQYSADFFDGAHFVMKGASPVTARELVRPSFRNWFRPNYPYVYATFRCAR